MRKWKRQVFQKVSASLPKASAERVGRKIKGIFVKERKSVFCLLTCRVCFSMRTCVGGCSSVYEVGGVLECSW